MQMPKLKGLNIIGGVIFIVIGLGLMLLRLLKAWGITWLMGTLLSFNPHALFGAWRFFIYLAALVYLGVAILGFVASRSRGLATATMIVGAIFAIFGLLNLFGGFALLPLLKFIAGLAYFYYGLTETRATA